jgi:hypothetical protein
MDWSETTSDFLVHKILTCSMETRDESLSGVIQRSDLSAQLELFK